MATDDNNATPQYFPVMGGSKGIKFDASNYRIDGGCVNNGDGTFTYTYTGYQHPGGLQLVFAASQAPILGDQVVNGVLVPRSLVPNPSRDVFQEEWPKPIINNDPGFQEKKIRREGSPTWPDNKRWIDWENDSH